MKKQAGPESSEDKNSPPEDATRQRISRRRLLLGGAFGVPLTALAGCGDGDDDNGVGATPAVEIDAALQAKVKTIVVIYGENRSFNNLFANFPGVEKPLAGLQAADYQQRDRDGSTLLATLPTVPHGWLSTAQTSNGTAYAAGTQYQTDLPNAPFALKGPSGEYLPLGLVHRDLWHVFYQNQMQINGGKNDQFVAWADSGGFTMGYYANTSYGLRLWELVRDHVLCDNFFQGAFGGSFLNHQYLISATAPRYPNADTSIAKGIIATTTDGTPTGTPLQTLATSPASAMAGIPAFGPSSMTPTETLADGSRLSYCVNTMFPPYLPTPTAFTMDATGTTVDLTVATNASVVPPQSHEHIGDKLDKKGIDWAWYAGAFQQTLDQHGANISTGVPVVPNFQWWSW